MDGGQRRGTDESRCRRTQAQQQPQPEPPPPGNLSTGHPGGPCKFPARVLTNLHAAPGNPPPGRRRLGAQGGVRPARARAAGARGRRVVGRGVSARAWTRPWAGAAPAERARGSLRAEGAAPPRRGPRPPPTRRPPPGPRGRLPFSSLHTFFFLLLGYMLPWGWLALSCKFPRLTGRQGVWSVGGAGNGGDTRVGKVQRLCVPRL